MKRLILIPILLLGVAGVIFVGHQKYGWSKGLPWSYSMFGHRDRTLEVSALIAYQGKPVRLLMRTECWTPGDPMTGVSMEAVPEQIAGKLPDGSIIAFRGMTHLCRYAEGAITAQLSDAGGPRVLGKQTPIPALPAIWFSAPRKPELVEESISPTSTTPRYRPINFSMREVPSGAPGDPAAAFHKTLPGWWRYESKSLGLCGGTVERLPPDMLSETTRREVAAGTFLAQPWKPGLLRPGEGPGLGADYDFTVPSEFGNSPEYRRSRAEAEARQRRTLAVTPDGDTWVAEPLQMVRYFRGSPPKAIRIGDVRLAYGRLMVAPLPGSPDVILTNLGCSGRH